MGMERRKRKAAKLLAMILIISLTATPVMADCGVIYGEEFTADSPAGQPEDKQADSAQQPDGGNADTDGGNDMADAAEDAPAEGGGDAEADGKSEAVDEPDIGGSESAGESGSGNDGSTGGNMDESGSPDSTDGGDETPDITDNGDGTDLDGAAETSGPAESGAAAENNPDASTGADDGSAGRAETDAVETPPETTAAADSQATAAPEPETKASQPEALAIYGFKALEKDYFPLEQKPELDRLLEKFPHRLTAYFRSEEDEGTPSNAKRGDTRKVEVIWSCAEDYEDPEVTIYHFTPEMTDEFEVEVSELPTITVEILTPYVTLSRELEDGLTISVVYDRGVFPDDARLEVSRIEDETELAAMVEAARACDDGSALAEPLALDIRILDQEDNELQPNTSAGAVSISLRNTELEQVRAEELEVYHFTAEDNSSIVKEKAQIQEDGISVQVEHFSRILLGRAAPGEISVTTTQELTAALADAPDGAVIRLAAGTYEGVSLEIDKNLKLVGEGRESTKLIGSRESKHHCIAVADEIRLDLSDLALDGAHGIDIANGNKPSQIYLSNVTISATEMGVCYTHTEYVEQNVLELDACSILQPTVADYETAATTGTRGLSLRNIRNSQVTVRDSQIKGYGYSINVNGTEDSNHVMNTRDLNVEIIDSEIFGWSVLNIWGSNAVYTIEGSDLLGVNWFSSDSNSFAAIVFNDDFAAQPDELHAEDNTLNIIDSTVRNYQGGTCTEALIRIDCGVRELNLKGNVVFSDTSGNLDSVLYLELMPTDRIPDFIADNIHTEGAGITSTTAGGGELPLVKEMIAVNTYVSGGIEKKNPVFNLSTFIAGVDYDKAAASQEKITLSADVSEPGFTVNSEPGHGNQYGGWTLDLAGHSLELGGWDADKVTLIDSSEKQSGQIYVNGQPVIAAKIGQTCYLTLEDAVNALASGEILWMSNGLSYAREARREGSIVLDDIYANGIPVVVEELGGRTYVHPAADSSYNSGWVEVTHEQTHRTEVYAGSGQGGAYESGSITMNSGTVFYLIGGSKGPGRVEHSTITMNGGTVSVIYGIRDSADSLEAAGTRAVGDFELVFNGGAAAALTGAFSYTHIDNIHMVVNGGVIAAQTSPVQAGILLAGTNGTVGNASLEFNGGSTKDIALAQRTLMEGTASISVNGGTVGNIYAGSYYDDGDSYAGSGWVSGTYQWTAADINYGQAQNIVIDIGGKADYDDIYAGFQFANNGSDMEEAGHRGAYPQLAGIAGARVTLRLQKAAKAEITGNNKFSESLTKTLRSYVTYEGLTAPVIGFDQAHAAENEAASGEIKDALFDKSSETYQNLDPETKNRLDSAAGTGALAIEPEATPADPDLDTALEIERKLEAEFPEGRASLLNFMNVELLIKDAESREVIGKVQTLPVQVAVTIVIPDEYLRENRDFYMIRRHGEALDLLPMTVSGNKGTFYSDRFSIYVLAYQDRPEEIPDVPDTPDTPDIPDTGSDRGGSGSGSGDEASGGQWVQDQNGWWYRYSNGSWPSSQWAYLWYGDGYSWYYFNENGYMVDGWIKIGNNWYFLHNRSDGKRGHMYTGWRLISGKWYFFEPAPGPDQGKLYVNRMTPDGLWVDENGVWVE